MWLRRPSYLYIYIYVAVLMDVYLSLYMFTCIGAYRDVGVGGFVTLKTLCVYVLVRVRSACAREEFSSLVESWMQFRSTPSLMRQQWMVC